MIRVWGRTNSSNVMKVLWLLDEIGERFERVDAGGTFGRTATPEYRAMNPLGLVPALEDDGYSLFESNAIMRYLCNTRDTPGAFYPLEAKARGTVDAWADMQQTALGPPQGVVFAGLIRTPAHQRDHAAIAAAVEQAGAVWALLDARLSARPFIGGDHLSIADIAFGVHAHRWFTMPIARPDAVHLQGWYTRLLERPPYATHVAQPLT